MRTTVSDPSSPKPIQVLFSKQTANENGERWIAKRIERENVFVESDLKNSKDVNGIKSNLPK